MKKVEKSIRKKHTVPYDSDIFDAKMKHNLSDGETVMLYALRKFTNEKNKGWGWPKQEGDLDKILCCSDRTVRTRINRLEACRLIQVEKRASTKKEGAVYNAYRFIDWWSSGKPETGKSVEPETGKFTSQTGKSTSLKPENSRQKGDADFPVNHIRESTTRRKNQQLKSSPPTPPGGFEEEDPKTFFQNGSDQQDGSNRFFSARRSNGSTARRGGHLSRMVHALADLKKSDPEKFTCAFRYADDVLQRRRWNFKLTQHCPVERHHEKEYLTAVAFNALWGDRAKREAFERWQEEYCTTANDSTDYTGKFRFEK